MSYEQLKLENQLCFPLYAASRLITRAYQNDLDAIGITYPQYLVLMLLWEFEELTVNEIGEKLILNTNTVTPLLKRMECQDLLLRVQSKSDHRKVNITLTDKGKNMQETAAEIPHRLVNKFNSSGNQLELEQAMELKNTLYKLIHILKLSEQKQS